jgi:undecaprenyl-diphosphatase
VQGITEFLPISSDGHLVLAGTLLGVSLAPRDALGFDILLHAASLLALLVCTSRTWIDLLRRALHKDRHAIRLLVLLALGTIPGALAGLLLEDLIAGQRTTLAAAAGFVVTALVLITAELMSARSNRTTTNIGRMRMRDMMTIGVAQAVALLPGVSRSGLTIGTGMMLGLPRRTAFDVSFLLAVPIIGGAVAKGALDVALGDVVLPAADAAATGFAASFVVSMVAYTVLRGWVARYSLAWFALYLLPLATILAAQSIDFLYLDDPAYVRSLLLQFGPIFLFLLAMAESTPPISVISPGVVAVLVAGSLAPNMNTLAIFFVATASGMFLASIVFYEIGHAYGRTIAHRFHLTEQRLHAAERLMRRIGPAGIVIGQFIGLLRPAIAFVAGTLAMPRWVFVPSAAAGACVWSGTYLIAGFLVGSQIDTVASVIGIGGMAITVVLLVVVAVWGWVVRRRKRRAQGFQRNQG